MALGSVTFEGFGGLDLSRDPVEVGQNGAVDLLNVDFDRLGRVRQRSGYSTLYTTTVTTSATGLQTIPFPSGTDTQIAIVTSAGTEVIKLNVGGEPDQVAVRSTAPRSAVAFGTPTASRIYIAESSNLVRWDGTSFTALGLPTAYANLAVTPWDNRLILAQTTETGPTTYPSRVRFSDAGDAETFGANNYIDLTPGDGEQIIGVAVWDNQVFVFKQTKCFVFYGTSTDAAGEPIFNYRTIQVPGGVRLSARVSVQAARDGVYVVTGNGLTRTTGQSFVSVPGPLDLFLHDVTHPFFTGATGADSSCGYILSATADRLAVTISGSLEASRVMLLYDPQHEMWMYSEPGVEAFSWDAESQSGSAFPYAIKSAGGSKAKLVRFSPALTTDDGAAITSFYRSGLYDLGSSEEKEIRDSDVHGTGTVGFSVARGYGSFPTARTLTLGTHPTPAEAHDNSAQYGETLSYKLSSVNGAAWQVNRITHRLRPERTVGMRAAA